MITTETPIRSELHRAQLVALARMKSSRLAAQRACLCHRESLSNAEQRFYFRTYMQFEAEWRSARTEYAAISAELEATWDEALVDI